MGLYDDLVTPGATPQPQSQPQGSGLYDDLAPATQTAAQQQPQGSTLERLGLDPESMKRAALLGARNAIVGATALPVMAGNAGIAAGDLFNQYVGPHVGLPYRPENQLQPVNVPKLLDRWLPAPQNAFERDVGALESGLTGAAMPAAPVPSAPANFMTPAETQAAQQAKTLEAGQDIGLRAPPATSNPNWLTRTIETVGGKTRIQQMASLGNREALQTVGKEALSEPELGINVNELAPLTAETPEAVRAEAATAGYEPIRSAGQLNAPANFGAQLRGAISKYTGAERSFPGMGSTELTDAVDKISASPTFDAGDALDLNSILRDRADAAFRAGDGGLGSGYRALSKNVESAIESGLQDKAAASAGQAGAPDYTGMLTNYRLARALMARSYTIQDAMNPATGELIGSKLAGALKTDPLTGDVATAARFAATYPRAVAPVTHSMGVSHLDTLGSLGMGVLGEHLASETKHPYAGLAAALLWPMARGGATSLALGPIGQSLAVPSYQFSPVSPNTVAGLGAGAQAAAYSR